MGTTLPLVNCWKFVGTTPNKFEGEKRYISTGALDCDHVNEADVEMVTFANRPSRANLAVATGDILFAKMASTEKTFVVDEVASEDIYSTGFCAVRADVAKILPKCLYYFLASSLFLDQKDKNSSGATQKAITNVGLAKIIINLPTLDEQRTFVAQMDLLCEAITARREQLAKLDELVKSRFIELFGDPVSNPKAWPVQNFEDISVLITDGEHATPRRSERGIYLLSARNVLNHTLQLDDVDFIDEEEYCRIARRVAPQEGDVLISCSGSIGRCCVVPANLRFQMVRSTALIRFTEEINPIFAEWLIASEELQRQIAQSATQSSQANLFQGKIQKLHGYVPPKELQDEFAAFAAEVDKSKLAVKQSLEKLETLKKSLMQQYFG